MVKLEANVSYGYRWKWLYEASTNMRGWCYDGEKTSVMMEKKQVVRDDTTL